ncbi:hypothetical protein Slin15195_G066390 [Septoria linicola]|uniref:PQ loop repeat protein n=1 Tax=Septoria linicola TaxID=215465 RepID=A0A9Q9AVI6_9PEZI|nr:hypothetical protein Slin15195_G066390 [Septoria linicola]
MHSKNFWSVQQSTRSAAVDSLAVPEECKHLDNPSTIQFTGSCLLMAWLFICYIPQWARIVRRKSAEGLSTLYILLGSLSGVCAIGNILILPSSAVEMGCCRTNSRFACISSLLGMLQIMFGIACFWVVLFMYVYYSEEEAEDEKSGRRNSVSGPERTFRRARRAWIVLLIVCGFALAVLLVSAVVLHRFPWYAQSYADTLGISMTVLASVQWLPQVYTTWHLGHLGSLSALALCLQTPYTWTFSINMIIRYGLSGWSVWVVYVFVGCMEWTLIGFAIVFRIRDRNMPEVMQHSRRASEVQEQSTRWDELVARSRRPSTVSRSRVSNTAPDERRPLLAHSRTTPS